MDHRRPKREITGVAGGGAQETREIDHRTPRKWITGDIGVHCGGSQETQEMNGRGNRRGHRRS